MSIDEEGLEASQDDDGDRARECIMITTSQRRHSARLVLHWITKMEIHFASRGGLGTGRRVNDDIRIGVVGFLKGERWKGAGKD